jgi:hypothetical protein
MSREIERTEDFVDFDIPADCPHCACAEIIVRVRVWREPEEGALPIANIYECTLRCVGQHISKLTRTQREALYDKGCAQALWEYNRSERERDLHAAEQPRRFERFPSAMILRNEEN